MGLVEIIGPDRELAHQPPRRMPQQLVDDRAEIAAAPALEHHAVDEPEPPHQRLGRDVADVGDQRGEPTEQRGRVALDVSPDRALQRRARLGVAGELDLARELQRDQLTARIAVALQPVGIHGIRRRIRWIGDDAGLDRLGDRAGGLGPGRRRLDQPVPGAQLLAHELVVLHLGRGRAGEGPGGRAALAPDLSRRRRERGSGRPRALDHPEHAGELVASHRRSD
jgi:hypothetical protein